MKKILISILFALMANISNCEDIKSYFYIKVVDGDPLVLEEICVEFFGDSFSFGNATKVFRFEASSKDRISFFAKIKEADMQVDSSSEKDAYEVRIRKIDPTIKEYHINTSIFTAEELVKVQGLLGNNIKGGNDEYVFVNNEDIASLKLAFKEMGFDCKFGSSNIFLNPLEYSFEVEYPEFMKDSVVPVLSEYSTKIQLLLESVRITITADKLSDLISNIEYMPFVEKVELIESTKMLIVEKSKHIFNLSIYVSSKANANKIINALSSVESSKVEDAFIKQEAGTLCVDIKLSSYSKDEDFLLKEASNIARKVIPSLRERDIKISLDSK